MSAPGYPFAVIPADVVSAGDYARHAEAMLDPRVWAYLDGGAGDEITLRENLAAFEALKMTPRVLADVSGGHTRLTLAGEALAHPFILAPVGWQKLFHPQGELASAQAAGVMQAPLAVSCMATETVEAIAGQGGPVWFQIYMQATRAATEALVRRAEAAGCRALLVTVDAPIGGIRNRAQRVGFSLPLGMVAANLPAEGAPPPLKAGASAVFDGMMRAAPGWADIEWLTRLTRLPVFVKGILHADDAERALSAGAAGIVVSNHGGRVLDTAPAAINALPAIAARLNGAAPILFDSGVRRGSDAFKAIALGADAVMIGRPYIWALSVAGALGVAHLLRTLREELEITMALMGCRTLTDIRQASICHA
ncbi:FMN-dependent alpha-hydroxy acid dehydrogenase family protein [Hyphomonas neptunium ATCC 15444]|uniref:FMN-dependent alpha-hydroxy acid dehydrogenase family protein n=2 Tax=Hyphomonas TaxID=85 RepID=Q0C0C8_HYPNA|nr:MULTISPECIES: alpha-hydroxy acid oxidase [Hyphomonas]ABI76219.1 FMN-dependent alpha-hydroxy acid dehydrogenase family protein [Hyphomonas neptunium ATCC 15444]KCZ90604.1 FMN-dependent alpha-hydroxy acid dehydrogenase family protein [Hyphomonas hirschiana VP5]